MEIRRHVVQLKKNSRCIVGWSRPCSSFDVLLRSGRGPGRRKFSDAHGRRFWPWRKNAPCPVTVTEEEHCNRPSRAYRLNTYVAFTFGSSKLTDSKPFREVRRQPVLNHPSQRSSCACHQLLLPVCASRSGRWCNS